MARATVRRVCGTLGAMLVVALLAGCDSSDPDLTSTQSLEAPSASRRPSAEPTRIAVPTTTASPQPSIAPDPPIDVTLTPDPDRRTTATVGIDGGRLDLDLGGGGRATLAIPKTALLGPTAITMTGVAIDGWSFAPKDRVAVQLEPDGLELFVPATLTIEQPGLGPDGFHGEIAWSGDGRSLRPIVARRDGDQVAIDIEHFSGYGLVWNLESDSYWVSWQKTRQLEAQAQLESEIALVLGFERQKQFLGVAEDDVIEKLVGYIDRWYDAVFEPLMHDGETTCEGGRRAMGALVSMRRQLETIGISVAQAYSNWIARRAPGTSTQYAFDEIPDAYLDNLVKQCDAEALSACRRTGDIALLLIYVKDRNNILMLFGKVEEDTKDGEALITACARYHVRASFEVGLDRSVYDTQTVGAGPPRSQIRQHWTIDLEVDLKWVSMGGAPWMGTIEGEALPTVRKLESRMRLRRLVGTDSGTSDKGWGPWCDNRFERDPWSPWRLQIASLEFNRERPVRDIKVMGAYVPAQTIAVEGPLETLSFQNAVVVFHQLASPSESYHSSCGDASGSSGTATPLDVFVIAQSPQTKWTGTDHGDLSAYGVEFKSATDSPLTLRREWVTGRTEQDTSLGTLVSSMKWNGSVVVTHTPER